jgi:hypothetical protein
MNDWEVWQSFSTPFAEALSVFSRVNVPKNSSTVDGGDKTHSTQSHFHNKKLECRKPSA